MRELAKPPARTLSGKTLPGAAGAILLAGSLVLVTFLRPDDARSFEAPAIGRADATRLSQDAYLVVPAMLTIIYDAFGETDEEAIYDGLARVAAGAALDALYLERLGAMVGGGLDGADQRIHEMNLSAQ